jgi:hypothetical protein
MPVADEITIQQFCDLQGGMTTSDTSVLHKMLNGQVKTYTDWYAYITVNMGFTLSEKKTFEDVIVADEPTKNSKKSKIN